MKRKALLAIAAAAAVAAVVVLTTTAFGGTGAPSDQSGDGFATFISCLASHGVQVPSDDPAAVKQWLGQRSQDDPVVQAALERARARPIRAGRRRAGATSAMGRSPARRRPSSWPASNGIVSTFRAASRRLRTRSSSGWSESWTSRASARRSRTARAVPRRMGRRNRQSGQRRRRGGALPSLPLTQRPRFWRAP